MGSICLLVLLLFTSSNCQQTNDLDQSFNNADDDNSECEAIEGNIGSCQSCFTCDHHNIDRYRKLGIPIQELSFKKSNSCTDRTRVCCIALDNLSQRQQGTDNCGRRVETRGRRSGPKSILQSEIPWHVHIYSANKQKLCAGTYISLQRRSILVPASCVRGKSAQDLRVSFRTPSNADLDNLAKVASVIVHNDYPSSSSSNIAVVRVSTETNIPHWVKPACLADRAPFTPIACMSITDRDCYVNTVVPQNCSNRITAPSQLCSIGIPGDYSPEFGAGLVCELQGTKELIYELHGIHLSSKSEDSSGTYTSISNFINWIDKQ